MDVINRTFVGILVPQLVVDQMQQGMMLLKRKPGVDNIRWSAPSEYLIQLASLGELSPGTLSILKQVLPPVIAGYPRLNLEIKGFSGHPNLIQPRFAHAVLEGDIAWLEQLALAVDRALSPCVPHRDIKSFRPYIVVGRLKTESEPLRVALGRALKMTQCPSMGTIAVNGIDLLVSRASEFGIGYNSLAHMPLG